MTPERTVILLALADLTDRARIEAERSEDKLSAILDDPMKHTAADLIEARNETLWAADLLNDACEAFETASRFCT